MRDGSAGDACSSERAPDRLRYGVPSEADHRVGVRLGSGHRWTNTARRMTTRSRAARVSRKGRRRPRGGPSGTPLSVPADQKLNGDPTTKSSPLKNSTQMMPDPRPPVRQKCVRATSTACGARSTLQLMSTRCGCPPECWCQQSTLRLFRRLVPRSAHRSVHPDIKRESDGTELVAQIGQIWRDALRVSSNLSLGRLESGVATIQASLRHPRWRRSREAAEQKTSRNGVVTSRCGRVDPTPLAPSG